MRVGKLPDLRLASSPRPMTDLALQQISLGEIVAACRRETTRFQRLGTSDPRFCLEVFQRALRLQSGSAAEAGTAPRYADEAARNELVNLYTDFILAHVNRNAVLPQQQPELVQDVWRNFWQAANNGLAFTSLAAALAYLRQVTVSEVIKFRRRGYRRAREESLQAIVEQSGQEPSVGPEDLFVEHARARFRARCTELLDDATEHQIYWMRYGLGYSPKEIAQRLSQTEDRKLTARNVSDILERCFRRLAEDPEIRALLQSD